MLGRRDGSIPDRVATGAALGLPTWPSPRATTARRRPRRDGPAPRAERPASPRGSPRRRGRPRGCPSVRRHVGGQPRCPRVRSPAYCMRAHRRRWRASQPGPSLDRSRPLRRRLLPLPLDRALPRQGARARRGDGRIRRGLGRRGRRPVDPRARGAGRLPRRLAGADRGARRDAGHGRDRHLRAPPRDRRAARPTPRRPQGARRGGLLPEPAFPAGRHGRAARLRARHRPPARGRGLGPGRGRDRAVGRRRGRSTPHPRHLDRLVPPRPRRAHGPRAGDGQPRRRGPHPGRGHPALRARRARARLRRLDKPQMALRHAWRGGAPRRAVAAARLPPGTARLVRSGRPVPLGVGPLRLRRERPALRPRHALGAALARAPCPPCAGTPRRTRGRSWLTPARSGPP